MRCIITGCDHSPRATNHSRGSPWKKWQICGCCALALGLVDKISGMCRVIGTFHSRVSHVTHGQFRGSTTKIKPHIPLFERPRDNP